MYCQGVHHKEWIVSGKLLKSVGSAAGCADLGFGLYTGELYLSTPNFNYCINIIDTGVYLCSTCSLPMFCLCSECVLSCVLSCALLFAASVSIVLS
jgi:hypothetical protein